MVNRPASALACGTLRLDGVVLLTNHDGVYLGDSRLDPVFDELNRRQAVVFLHPAPAAGPAWGRMRTHTIGMPVRHHHIVIDTHDLPG